MRTMRMIWNRKGGDRDEVREAARQLQREGYRLDLAFTQRPGDALALAREARDDGLDVVIAAGGDGTVHEVVNGLCAAGPNPHTALGILPLGTANDFASSLGIPAVPIDALRLAATGRLRRIDVGRVNETLFVNVASGGIGAAITTSTPADLKAVLGGAAYSLVGLFLSLQMTPFRATLTWEQGQITGEFLILSVGNGRQAGGGYPLTHAAYLDDGLLDLVMVPSFDVGELEAVVGQYLELPDTDESRVVYRQLADFRLTMPEPHTFNLDGEPYTANDWHFRVGAGWLPLVVPDGTPLLSRG